MQLVLRASFESDDIHWWSRELEEKAVLYLSEADERANILTHSLGILLTLCGSLFLSKMAAARPVGFQITVWLFSLSMLSVYCCSVLSHAFVDPSRRHRMRAWDQGTIYLLIAGTYSPFIWTACSEVGRVTLMCIVWTLAGIGFYTKVFASYRINSISTLTYLLLGWLPAFAIVASTPTESLRWMVIGGISYSLGVIFLMRSERMVFMHATWHTFVMLGSASHWYAIYLLAMGA